MKEEIKKSKLWTVIGVFAIVALSMIVLANIYLVWDAATTKVSGNLDCQVNAVEYVTLSGNGTCVFPLASSENGDMTICGLPQDFHCSGTLQNFPIVKAIAELG